MLANDIILKQVIVHISKPSIGRLMLSSTDIDLRDEFSDFLKKQIEKVTESDDIVPVQVKNEDYLKEENFIEKTRCMAEEVFDICCKSVKIPDADLVFLQFHHESITYFAMLKMDYQQFYIHKNEEKENSVIVQNVMTTSCKEAFVYSMNTAKGVLLQKKYEMYDGTKSYYLSEYFLKQKTGLCAKKKFSFLIKVMNMMPEETIQDKLENRLKVWNMYKETGQFDICKISDNLFKNCPVQKKFFDEMMEKKDIAYDKFTIKKEATVRKLEFQTLILESGIELKLPIEAIHQINYQCSSINGVSITLNSEEVPKIKS